MTLHIPFDNSYATLGPEFFTPQGPAPATSPELIAYNEPLSASLGITPGSQQELAAAFAGNTVPDGAAPLAQLYAGHQFGTFNPQLGDGRALLLGEVVDHAGARFDIQLKGSGPTPYSRMGDGRAWLGPVLREYVVSEAMHALGVPTTRALAAVATGDPVYREDGGLPGAVLTRVASSHIRVGTFQVFAHRGKIDALKTLTDYTIARHYPDADGPMGLLRAVVAAQAALIPAWMSFGFIHGVMNTDNCALSGETIDYGPCAFIDEFHPGKVFSSIDRTGRYAYGNQPSIAVWNLAQLATALIQQLDDPEAAVPEATEIIHAMPDQIEANWRERFGRKIGIAEATPDDVSLIDGLLTLMAEGRADFTNTFRALGDGTARDQFTDRDAFDGWAAQWEARVAYEADPEAVMHAANPAVIPRNHRVEDMIQSAVAGDFAPLHRLQNALQTPFVAQPEFSDLTQAPQDHEIVPATFCGT